MHAMRCPRCRTGLAPASQNGARFDRCAQCRGVSFNLAVLRQFVAQDRLSCFWQRTAEGRPGGPCPSCNNAMTLIAAAPAGRDVELDACRRCQLLWFDADELAAFSPERQAPPPPSPDFAFRDALDVAAATPGAASARAEARLIRGEVDFVVATILRFI